MQTAAELRKTFRKINTSNDGWLTYEEFAVILKKVRLMFSNDKI